MHYATVSVDVSTICLGICSYMTFIQQQCIYITIVAGNAPVLIVSISAILIATVKKFVLSASAVQK